MARRATLRASDADRERVVERLREATSEGRLLPEELEQRLEEALSARTYGELDLVLADLPGRQLAKRRRAYALPGMPVPPALALAVAIPIALAVVTIVVFAVTGVLAVWWLWLVLGWWFFGGHHRRRRYGARSWHACGGGHRRGVPTQGSRGFWA